MSDASSGDGGSPDVNDTSGDEPTRRLPPEDEATRRMGSDVPGGTSVEERGFLDRFGDRDLPVAIGVGVVLVAILIGTVLWSRAAFTALVMALVLVGVVETAREFRSRGVMVSVPVLVVSALVLLVGTHQSGHAGQAVGVVTLFFGAIVWELTDKDRRDVVQRVGATVLLGVWIPFLGSYAVLLHGRGDGGWIAIIATVGAAVLSDIGAYFIGTRFGERKLAPTVSPGKTWEGVLGGIAVAVTIAVVVLPLLGSEPLFGPGTAALFTAVVAGVAVVGDLAESMLKRDLGVKDFGGIIPGHGGVLDRVDAILFALPVGYYLLDVLAR